MNAELEQRVIQRTAQLEKEIGERQKIQEKLLKMVNDSLAHLVGDRLLIAVTRRLESCLHPINTISCLGGDEFTILLENITNIEDAISIAERLQREMALPFQLDLHQVICQCQCWHRSRLKRLPTGGTFA